MGWDEFEGERIEHVEPKTGNGWGEGEGERKGPTDPDLPREPNETERRREPDEDR